MIKSTERAYEALGQVLTRKASQGWSSLHAICPILNKGCGGITTVQKSTSGEADIPIGMDVFVVQDACLFLRDDLLKTTGQRIWCLTFTLYLDGKVNIEYDYNRPEDYEETDETIDVSPTAFINQFNKK
jgi:hypothetical protein